MIVVFPAQAGMSPCVSARRADVTSVPRASGDEPSEAKSLKDLCECSPRERERG